MATEIPQERASPIPKHLNTRPRLQVEDTPYFLSLTDHINLILTASLLTGPNYQSWKRGIFVSLAAKNKTAFVDGSLPRPPPTDSYLSHWLRCSNMVISWILHSVSPNIAESIMFRTTAAAMWKDLSDCFNQCNGPRVFQLRESAIALKQGNQDVQTYFTRLKFLWDEFAEFHPTATLVEQWKSSMIFTILIKFYSS
ncbi:uncharacterized protein LOC133825630 [Humulus lupulus]|uniref:uncharacterized protein LOC133825630 n=1 Tax=Humulus lupulus TaxID=3486 RepID=UPI002B409C13|nr:uncharacterized protein LOC133825630 [Humulus lupulus]